jgi:prepilin-type N-terminal cleavage/methylation domain-containing protein
MTGSASHRKRLGFTMIEVLTVLMATSVVVRIGVPSYQEVALKAEAVQVAADLNVVRAAVNEFQSEHHRWPEDFGPGLVPPELAPFLDGLTFNRGRYQLDWQNWVLPDGLPNRPGARAILAVSVVTEDRALGAAVRDLLGTAGSHFTLGDSYTFVLDID